ncbi:MAG TPA: hypothetical protein VJV75_10685, partial [Candidatus Polarisedimenticolia bacterium]|nr:hypothetical protein [Candidatus Polarisedimenticolia bacterium]
MAAPESDLQEVPPHARRLEAFATALLRLEREPDLHSAAALFLSVLRQQCTIKRAVLTITDPEARHPRWFFAGLTDADIDYFHAHRPTPAELDGWLQEKHRAGRTWSLPPAACRDGAGLR